MDEFTPILEEFGLSTNEARTYLAGIMLGSSTANDIAQKSELLRTTTYEILKRLIEKGLATQFEHEGIIYFDMVDPKVVLLREEEKQKRFREILPQFEKIKESVERKPKVQLFLGYRGIKSLLDVQLHTERKVCILGKIDHSNRFLGPYRDQYIKKRTKKKIKARVLIESGNTARDFKSGDIPEYRETKTLSMCHKLNATFMRFGEHTAIITFLHEDPVGILISDKNIAESFNVIFQELWNAAKK